jgi:hypothetical protein
LSPQSKNRNAAPASDAADRCVRPRAIANLDTDGWVQTHMYGDVESGWQTRGIGEFAIA